jgi:hypothetical protein
MTNLEILWTIGAVVGIIAGFITIYTGFRRINLQQLTNFFSARRRTILNVTYITLISAFTILYIVLFTYIDVVLRVFSFQWVLLLVIIAFSTVGLWSPVLMSRIVWGGRFRRIVNWVMLAFGIFMLVGFWIISWPTDLLRPSILTGVAVIALVADYLYRHRSRIRAKTMQCWDNVKSKTMQYWHIIGTRIRKGSSS